MADRRLALRCLACSSLLACCLICTAIRAGESANPDRIEAAGCLIATPGGFVMGINRLINRLQLPAGRHAAGESARQTAARETYEETGLAVEVGEVALSLDSHRVVFFFCTASSPATDFASLAPVDRVEVSRVLVVNPVTLKTADGAPVDTAWRFPQMRWLLRSVFAPLSTEGAR